MVNVYFQGNVVRCSTQDLSDPDPANHILGFTSNGALVDPDNVYFVCTKSDGTEIRYHYGVDSQLVRVSIGYYTVDVTTDQADHQIPWEYRFYSTGNYVASMQNRFFVTPAIPV